MTQVNTPSPQVGTQFTYPGELEDWVDLSYLAMEQPGVKIATSRSQVRRPNHYTTEPPFPLTQTKHFISPAQSLSLRLHLAFPIFTFISLYVSSLFLLLEFANHLLNSMYVVRKGECLVYYLGHRSGCFTVKTYVFRSCWSFAVHIRSVQFAHQITGWPPTKNMEKSGNLTLFRKKSGKLWPLCGILPQLR